MKLFQQKLPVYMYLVLAFSLITNSTLQVMLAIMKLDKIHFYPELAITFLGGIIGTQFLMYLQLKSLREPNDR